MKPSSISSALQHLYKINRSVFIWGPPGVGKSDLVEQTASDLKISMVDIRLSLYDPVDLKGFPVIEGTGANKAMHFVPPAILPKKGKGILFLDELPTAPPSVQAAAYQLVLNGQLGEYKLPPGWAVVAAGNRASDRGPHFPMAPALANRFVHIDFDIDADDWDSWAAANGVSVYTRAFIKARPDLLHDMKLSARAFPTPRSWVYADQIMNSGLGSAIEHSLVAGTIGEGAAIEYIAFHKTAADLPTYKEIVAKPDKAKLPDSPAARYAAVLMTAANTMSKDVVPALAYIERMPKDFQALYVRETLSGKNAVAEKLKSNSHLGSWVARNPELFAVQ